MKTLLAWILICSSAYSVTHYIDLNSASAATLYTNGGTAANQPSFIILGDSLTAQNGRGYEKVLPDAEQWASSMGYFNRMRTYLSGQVSLLSNAGVGGEVATEILARVDADVIKQVPPPEFCIICAGRNDISQSIDVETITIPAINEIEFKLSTAGITTIWMNVTPSGGDTPENIEQTALLNAHIATLPNAVDIWSAVVGPAGLPRPGTSRKSGGVVDNTHWGEQGADAVGRTLAPMVESLCTPVPFEWFDEQDDANVLTNPTFENDAAGWRDSGGTHTVENGVVTVTSTSDQFASLFTEENISSGRFAVGDVLRAAVDVEWEISSSAGDRERRPHVWVRVQNINGSFTYQLQALGLASNQLNEEMEGGGGLNR